MLGISNIAMAIPTSRSKHVRFTALPKRGLRASTAGIFVLAYDMRDDPDLSQAERDQLEDILAWFRKNLRVPPRFSKKNGRAQDPHNVRGISWFKPGALEHIAKIRELVQFLDAHGIVTQQIEAERVGYVVYEDEFQVVAEPFAELR